MRNSKKLAGIAAITALVSGCGGGGGAADRPSYATLNTQNIALHSAAPAGQTPVGDMPGTGSATYNGILALLAPDQVAGPGVDPKLNPNLVGQMSMTVDFDALAADAITGSVTNIVRNAGGGAEDNPQNGSLTISSSTGVVGNGFSAKAVGDLIDQGTASNPVQPGDPLSEPATYDLDLTGNFYGPGAEFVSGTVDGTASRPFGGGTLVSDLEGVFVGETQ